MISKQLFNFSILLISCVLLFTDTKNALASQQEYPEDIAIRLQQKYDSMTSLSFKFNQDTRGELTGRPRKGSGSATFLKSDTASKMRWDYINPKKQVILSDSVHFYMYFEELQQMIISPAENLENDLTYSFFAGKGKLQKDFYIRPANEEFTSATEDTFGVIKLIPIVPHSQVQDIHLWVSEDSLIRRIHIQDHFGTITVLNLSDIQPDVLKNHSPADINALFSFDPPEGTEIIEQ